eukprot:TRINITY_DN3571_c0_g1_i2.p1 TRINITY_DN3571_c0_g1~~TRINITY_DN3571_c0_g1_i2.p1  ORF type:complete len:254 (-),score=36.28 TRINITY_DN3571_c0_g1_i2:227-988(-)
MTQHRDNGKTQNNNANQKKSDMEGIQQALKIYYDSIGQPNVQVRIHSSKQSRLESVLACFCRIPSSVITPVGFYRIIYPYLSIITTFLMEYSWLLIPVGLLLIKYASFGSIFAMVCLTLFLIGLFMYAETFKEKEKSVKELIWAENRGQVVRRTVPKNTLQRFQQLWEQHEKKLSDQFKSINEKSQLENDVKNLEDAVFGNNKKNGDGDLQIRIERLSKQLGQKFRQNSAQLSLQDLMVMVDKLQDVVFGGQN